MTRQGGWLLPLSAAFATSTLATVVAFSTVPGCQTRCLDSFDCGDEGGFCVAGRCEIECFIDEDCQKPPECEENPAACTPKGLRCNSSNRCVGTYRPRKPGGVSRPAPRREVPTEIEGWEENPGTGRAFIVESLRIADKPEVGFDIDGKCRGPGECIDNSLAPVGQLGNDQIRQGLLGGETLLLIELAGLDEPFRGDDKTVTVKFYGARDADEPFFPANNFQIPSGETKCCEFKINPQSIAGIPPQARARAPAKLERGQLKSLAPMPIQFTLTVGVPPYPEIRIERVLLSARLPSNLRELKDGLLGGAVPINTLAQTENPYCKTVSDPLCPALIPESTLIDLVVALQQPDIDLDIPADGLERMERDVLGNGRIKVCKDGNQLDVRALVPMQPWSCTLQPEMADGFSVALEFAAVAATVLGVGQ